MGQRICRHRFGVDLLGGPVREPLYKRGSAHERLGQHCACNKLGRLFRVRGYPLLTLVAVQPFEPP